MHAPSTTLRLVLSALGALALTAIAAPAATAATPTLGIEWELKFAKLALATGDNTYAPVPTADPARYLCSTAQAPAVGDADPLPLVSLTPDNCDAATCVLEIVTGPIDHDSAQWNQVTEFVSRVFAAARALCGPDDQTTYLGTPACAVSLRRLAERMNQDSEGIAATGTACGRDAEVEENAVLLIRARPNEDRSGWVSTLNDESFTQPQSTHVNIALPLTRFSADVATLLSSDDDPLFGALVTNLPGEVTGEQRGAAALYAYTAAQAARALLQQRSNARAEQDSAFDTLVMVLGALDVQVPPEPTDRTEVAMRTWREQVIALGRRYDVDVRTASGQYLVVTPDSLSKSAYGVYPKAPLSQLRQLVPGNAHELVEQVVANAAQNLLNAVREVLADYGDQPNPLRVVKRIATYDRDGARHAVVELRHEQASALVRAMTLVIQPGTLTASLRDLGGARNLIATALP